MRVSVAYTLGGLAALVGVAIVVGWLVEAGNHSAEQLDTRVTHPSTKTSPPLDEHRRSVDEPDGKDNVSPDSPLSHTNPRVSDKGTGGRVVDSDGKTVLGASVWLLPVPDDFKEELLDGGWPDWAASGIEHTTDENGRFPIQVRDSSEANVAIARKEGHAWDFVPFGPGIPSELVLQLGPTHRLGGVVKTDEGTPVSRAKVQFRRAYPFEAESTIPTWRLLALRLLTETITTDVSGRFEFSEMGSAQVRVNASAEGFVPVQLDFVRANMRLNITMIDGAIVHGTVVNAQGKPVESAWITSIALGTMPAQTRPWLRTGSDGTYEIDPAHSGSVGVACYPDGHPLAIQRQDLEIEPGEEMRVDFVLKDAGTMTGTAVDSNERPIQGITLSSYSQTHGYFLTDSVTDGVGRFSFKNLALGEMYYIDFPGDSQYGPLEVHDILAGTEGIKISLQRVARVWGAIEFGGEPSRATIRLVPRRDLGDRLGVMTMDDFILDNWRERVLDVKEDHYGQYYWAGIYDVEFQAAGYAPIRFENYTLVPGRQPDPIDLYFTTGTQIRGMVLDLDGTAIPDASVRVVNQSNKGLLRLVNGDRVSTTDESGRFEIQASPDEQVAIRVEADGFAWKTVRNVSAESESLVIRLGSGGRIEGAVETKYASPPSTLEIIVREIGCEDGRSSFVSEKRAFSIENVPEGLVEVVLEDHYYSTGFPDVEPQVRQVDVGEGQTVRVDFDAATGVILKGRVEGWDKPLLIEARKLDDAGGKAVIAGASYTGPSGEFRIPHMLRGHYRIGSSLGQPGYSVAVAQVVEIGVTEPGELILTVPGNPMNGHVSSLTGNNLSLAVVHLYRSGETEPISLCLTDSDGVFSIGGIEDGLYDVEARAKGHGTLAVSNLRIPIDEANLTLRPQALVEVSVVDDTGALLSGAFVSLESARSLLLSRQDITGTEGKALLANLDAHSFSVTAGLDGYLSPEPVIITAKEGRTSPVLIELIRLGTVTVSVENELGVPRRKLGSRPHRRRGRDVERDDEQEGSSFVPGRQARPLLRRTRGDGRSRRGGRGPPRRQGRGRDHDSRRRVIDDSALQVPQVGVALPV